VTGTIVGCADSGGACAGGAPLTLDGTVDGIVLDPTADTGPLVDPDGGVAAVRFAGGDGLILLYDDGAYGLVLLPDPAGKVIYCTGADTVVSPLGPDGAQFTLANLSRLGPCADAAVSGAVDACIDP
jgi:hypothetical protein